MFPNNVQLLEFLGRERDKERLAEAEHIRLVRLAKGQEASYGGGLRTFATCLGHCLVKWGEKLLDAGSAPLPEVISKETSVESHP